MLSWEDKREILSFAEIIAEELLCMKTPEIIFLMPDSTPTETTIALLVVGPDKPPKIHISPKVEFTPEVVLYVAHELRHCYQYYVLKLIDEFELYQSSSQLSVEEYNLQPLELDANAFGALCMIELTGCKPLWNGLPDSVTQRIDERMHQIIDEEFL